MFHVERITQNRIIKGITSILLIIFILQSCIGAKAGYQIDDYYIAENGKEILGTKPLNAFIFENNVTNLPFEQFLAIKYKLDNYLTREFWINIDGARYKMIVYENSEFDKYFGISNFAAKNQENIANIVGGQPKFIAISMISEFNEDCLSNKSILQNMATTYLKNLKDEYIQIK
ncbi:hypothetical protein CLV94_1419 [Flavobacterium endophyticum]|uniref:Lipoprotein n=1 Tax=Flavobacterium endophyticum TaxID=1540163 RepID=A0A495MMQ9_9FLAO|nr:hypothetical protein CLV94_1419 [Flavobacterium endophyticum]